MSASAVANINYLYELYENLTKLWKTSGEKTGNPSKNQR